MTHRQRRLVVRTGTNDLLFPWRVVVGVFEILVDGRAHEEPPTFLLGVIVDRAVNVRRDSKDIEWFGLLDLVTDAYLSATSYQHVDFVRILVAMMFHRLPGLEVPDRQR